MNLENSLKFHSAKTQRFTDEPPATKSESLTNSDVMAAMGMTQAEAGFGMAAFFGKAGISQHDGARAIKELIRLALPKAGKLRALASLDGRKKALAIEAIASFAYQSYCMSAEAPGARCMQCKGRGNVLDVEKSKEANERVEKTCKRCSGRGYKTPTASKLLRALKVIAPDLSQPTFSRQIKPFAEELVSLCFAAESKADDVLKSATR